MRRPEQALQIAVAAYLRVALKPPVWWSAVDHGVGKLGKAEAGLRKARGVKPGIPDIIIFAPAGHYETKVLGIELKANGGTLSDNQKDVIGAWAACSAGVNIARSVADVVDILAVHKIKTYARLT